MSETVPNNIRDEVMSNILAKPCNQICFDCGSKAPKWSSPYLGIVICYECAARHRSYGTHISFVRSVDLDKWNRKQLKSLELTGNSYTKERFNDLGVPLIGNTYDYNNSLVLKVRQEIADKVKNELKEDEYMPDKGNENSNNAKKEEKINFDDIQIDETKNNNDEEKEKEKKATEKEKEESQEKEDEIQKPQKFQVNSNVKVNNVKVKGKAGKKNKIKKVDFDFDFDSFNDVNFADFNKKDDEEDNKKNDNFDEIDNKKKEEEKEKEQDEDNDYSYETRKPKKDIKKFANKKAISSEDYAALDDNDYTNKNVKDKIKSMGNTQAISSEDVFGSNESNDYQGESMTDKLKEMALNFTLSAAEKAKELKNKTNDLINKVQNKLGGSGGY